VTKLPGEQTSHHTQTSLQGLRGWEGGDNAHENLTIGEPSQTRELHVVFLGYDDLASVLKALDSLCKGTNALK